MVHIPIGRRVRGIEQVHPPTRKSGRPTPLREYSSGGAEHEVGQAHRRPPGSGSASDIGIRDGQAAIEFRSYYSGASVIEATSTGLANSSVTITSQGSPAWVEGTTPKVAPRPYQP